jgi:3'-phosphoadenosine 5'-phosphosulfate sulfotransferase (PAPS reductase)/FAD synthetase
MQAWPLERKIQVTQTRIMEWYMKWEGKVYVSFSGGIDSTVLLDLARRCYPDVPAVFCDTGLEYSQIRDFVKTVDNVEFIYPLMWDKKKREYKRVSFKTVIDTYGYPIISKEQAAFIQEYRDTKSEKLKDIRWNGNKYGRGKISDKWKPLVDAPFKVSDKCCDVMKKTPAKVYEKRTGRHPIIGTTTEESKQRESNWLLYGCNAFDKKRPTSQPMSFWTKQDTLHYLSMTGIPYCSLYGEIYCEDGVWKNTGVERTGCVFCGFGAQCDKEPTRFQNLKTIDPTKYNYCFKPVNENGLGMGEVLDYIGVKYE